MTRKELQRLMPKGGDDLAAAEVLIKLGHPAVDPILPDMVRVLRIAKSSAADAFAEFFATHEYAAVTALAHELRRENCWMRHRVFTKVLPKWSDASVSKLSQVLTEVATQPDAYDNDVRAIQLLALRKLGEPQWLRDWVQFKIERWKVRQCLLEDTEHLVANS